jgi:hypothetical protein
MWMSALTVGFCGRQSVQEFLAVQWDERNRAKRVSQTGRHAKNLGATGFADGKWIMGDERRDERTAA